MDVQFVESLQVCDKLLHKDKEGKETLEKLNTYMQGGDKWKQRFAICILNCVLRKCSVEVFEENATSWMRFLLQVINTVPSDNLLNLCFSSLKEILLCAVNVDKVHRDIATKGMDPLLALLVGPSLPLSPQKLNMLRCCIENFPGPCGGYRAAIETLLISTMESNDQSLCLSACQMYVLLAVCGTRGEKKNRFVENWVDLFYRVVNTTKFYFSKLNTNVATAVADDKRLDSDEISTFILFSDISERSEINTLITLQRIERLLLMLQHFINTAMSFEVPFPVLKLVNLFCEISNMLHTQQEKMLSIFHVSLLRITQTLLHCITATIKQFKTVLLPFAEQFSKILKSTISLSYLTNRSSAYKCSMNMLTCWKVFPQTSNFVESILTWIFTDIKVERCSSSIEDNNITNSNNRNDHAHRLADDINKHAKKEIHHFNYIACENAYSALTFVESLLLINGPFLAKNNVATVISNVLNVLVKLYGKEGFLCPYDCEENRVMLFKVIKCLLTLHHNCVEIPTSVLLSFVSIAACEPSDKVKCYCHCLLLEYDLIIHPVNVSYSEALYSQDNEVEVKDEPLSRPNSNEALVVSLNRSVVNNVLLNDVASSNGGVSCSAAQVGQFIRLCSSADEVVVHETTTLPARSSSEPTEIHQQKANPVSNMQSYQDNSLLEVTNQSGDVSTNLRQYNNNNVSLPTVSALSMSDNSLPGGAVVEYNENSSSPLVNMEGDSCSANSYDESTKGDDDNTVVISDSSEEGGNSPSRHVGIQEQYQPAQQEKYQPVPRIPPTTLYSPTAKKAKLSTGSRGNTGYQEDPEYHAILDTFCDIDADDD